MSDTLEEIGCGLARFLREYNREMLRVSLGEKPNADRFSIFQKHAHLFDVFTISDLGEIRSRETGDSRRRTSNLERFLQKAYPMAMVSDLTDQVEEMGAEDAGICGPPLLSIADVYMVSREPDRDTRREGWTLREERLRNLNPVLDKRLSRLHKASRELGFDGLSALCLQVRGLDISWLSETLEIILDRTESLYLEMLDEFLEPLGIPLGELERHDVLHVLSGNEFDHMFPAEGTWYSLAQATEGLGTVLGATGPIRTRAPGCGTAHYLPVDVPEEVYLFMEPRGGFMDYIRHFGEAGRAMQTGAISPEMPAEYRLLGDPAASESSSFLMQRIISSRPWLKARGDDETIGRFRRLFYLHRVFELRRLASLLTYELRLNSSSLSDAKELHRSIMSENMHFQYGGEDHLMEIIDPFRSSDRIRGFIFEAMLRKALLEKFGEKWCIHPSTREILKELWTSGGKFGLEDLSNCIGYAELDMEPLVEEIEDHIRLI
jgi:hypothetical protein